MKKDIKKSSYYVWFLGAEEAKGLRGPEFMVPVIRSLVEREREVEPFKVTLQVSHKGLKIIQNIPTAGGVPVKVGKSGKSEIVKHFIPHHAVTSVFQEEDIVSCILLLYNPVTKCPVHVHAYRCDSIETAEILCGQLQTLLERPENQRKLEDIETKLRAKGLLSRPRKSQSSSSEGRSSDISAGSSGSERLSTGNQEARIANLYDSLAAELREKLNIAGQPNHAPILLPPRDYDTVHRQKGNLSGIDFRRCLNMNIVGMNAASKAKRNLDSGRGVPAIGNRNKIGSSGGSSGIGSDNPPSPEQECDRYLDDRSTSDEEWNAEPASNSLFLVQTNQNNWRSRDMSLPRARRHNSGSLDGSVTSPGSPKYTTDLYGRDNLGFEPNHLVSKDDRWSQSRRVVEKKRSPEVRQRTPSPADIVSPKERFKDAKEKFLLLEKERLEEQDRLIQRHMDRRRLARVDDPIRRAINSPPKEERTKVLYRQRSLEEGYHVEDRGAPRGFRGVYSRNKSMENLHPEEYAGPSVRSELPRSKLSPFPEESEDKTQYQDRPYASPSSRTTSRSYSEDHLPDRYYTKRTERLSRTQVPFEDKIPLQRYRSPPRMEQPSVRHYQCEEDHIIRTQDIRRRAQDIEEEKHRNSNEIVKELKRRSYQERHSGSEMPYEGASSYEERTRVEHEVYRRPKSGGRVSPLNGVTAVSPRYRHSYAEPYHHRAPAAQHSGELLHRTNSSLSSGRIGIAAVHHY